MRYQVKFREDALKEWQKLGVTVREQFKKKLEDVLKRPRNPSAKLLQNKITCVRFSPSLSGD